MARFLAILLVLGGLAAFLHVHAQGADRAFGGALARFSKPAAPATAAAREPAPRSARDGWENEDRPAPQGIGQRVRERVNGAMEQGTRRHGGG